jgi:hypothetical protein
MYQMHSGMSVGGLCTMYFQTPPLRESIGIFASVDTVAFQHIHGLF